MTDYFSDRELGPRARTVSDISPVAWEGIIALVTNLIGSNSLAAAFPESCPDGGSAIAGTNEVALAAMMRAEIPGLDWPLVGTRVTEQTAWSRKEEPWSPPAPLVMDLLEFLYRRTAEATPEFNHTYYRHHHLRFDPAAGRTRLREDVNRLLARNGLAYELDPDGRIRRLPDAVLGQALVHLHFNSPDTTLNGMLEEARRKFLDRDLRMRREGMERLWDAFERIKTIHIPSDKSRSATKLIEHACSGNQAMAALLDAEMRALTAIGNEHLIRHHEMRQHPILDSDHVDFLFHRMYALVALLVSRGFAA